MNTLSRAEIVGQELISVYGNFDGAGVVELKSGAAFSLPHVLMSEVCGCECTSSVAPLANAEFVDVTIVDLLRPKDLSDLDSEMQESIKVQLSSGLCFS